MHQPLRRRAAVACTALILSALAPVAASSASGSAASKPTAATPSARVGSVVKVIQQNVAGKLTALQQVMASVDTSTVDFVTLQEVCEADYYGYLQGFSSWSVHYQRRAPQPDVCGGQPIGTAVLSPTGGLPKLGAIMLHTDDRGGSDWRLVCLDKVLAGKTVRGCTTHLPLDAAQRLAVTTAIKQQARSWSDNGNRVVIGGDFNATPMLNEMGKMYAIYGGTGDFKEGDQAGPCPAGQIAPCRGGADTLYPYQGGASRKVDYVFYPTSFTNVSLSQSPLGPDPATTSDHHRVVSQATVN